MEPNQTKLTGLNAINTTLNRGSVGDQVKALQQYLIGLGYKDVRADGVFGPVTEAAVKQFQFDNGLKGDGVFGPLSLNRAQTLGNSSEAAGAPGTGKAPDDPSNMFNMETGELNDKFVPRTQEELDKFYGAYAAAHPVFAGNDPDTLAYAAETGDFSVLLDSQGQPFSGLQQKDAMKDAERALAPGFNAEKSYDTAGQESDLSGQSREYGDFLNTSKENFIDDKNKLDETAAENGVLFSGGRYEKERKLQDAYTRNEETNRLKMIANVGNTARNFQYQYGNKAAAAPKLSQYYQLGGNTYNANSARNNVGSSPLSKIYNTGDYDFQGTKVNANKAAASVRAANLLTNRGNKLLSSGFNNQF